MKFVCLLSMLLLMFSCSKTSLKYPKTLKENTVDNYFGIEVPDPYRWLEDDRTEQTLEWVKSQNELTFSYLEKIPFRDKITKRLTDIYNYPRMSAPWKESDYYFYAFNNGLQNQDVYYYTKSIEEKGEIFIDPNTFSEKGTIALTNFKVSKDGKYVGYGISRGGSDWREFFVKELETGVDLDDHLKWIKFSHIAWYKDGFFYNRYNEPGKGDELKGENLNSKIFYHKVGSPQSEDILIYEDPVNPGRSYNASVTEDETMLVIDIVESTSGNAVMVKSLPLGNNDFIKLVDDFEKDYYLIGNRGTRLLFLTNFDASMYKLIEIDLKDPAREKWKDIIPEKKSQVLKSCSMAGDKIIAHYYKDACSVLEVYSREGDYLYNVDIPGIGTILTFNSKDNDNTAFYTFTSFNVPPEVYQYDVKNNTSKLYYKPEIDFDSENYLTKQVFYESKDGTKIPMFIVHHKDFEPDGNSPALLYGYGGFNITYTPAFAIRNVILLENGGVYALAGIRGGGEYGEEWHKAGTVLNKQNVFDDFIAAAEYLIAEKYTSARRLAIQGGSNGGLLIGAVINQRPDLFAVALPAVGVMDMLRYHLFTIGRYWVSDYGSSQDSVQFNYLYRYSPLHNIKKGIRYPAVLVTTADHDDRVVPAHSFKYIATLQEKQSGNKPVLIRIEAEAGHGAGKPVSMYIAELADIWSFTFYQMKFKPFY